MLVYTDEQTDRQRCDLATSLVERLIATNELVVSTQVLQEYFSVTTRKLKTPAATAREKVELLASLHVVQIDPVLILEAIDLRRAGSISFWDALIVRAAAVAGCAELLTEDLQHGARIAGVRVVDPFAG